MTPVITGIAGALFGVSEGFAFGWTAFVTLALLGLAYPMAIAGQVIAGSALCGALLLSEAVAPLLVLPLVAGVVATAELLALAGRLHTPQPREVGGDMGRIAAAVIVGGGVFGAVQALGGLPGPTGLLAVGLASGACVVLSLVLVGRRP